MTDTDDYPLELDDEEGWDVPEECGVCKEELGDGNVARCEKCSQLCHNECMNDIKGCDYCAECAVCSVKGCRNAELKHCEGCGDLRCPAHMEGCCDAVTNA